ncbi:competence protein CoiA [Paenibacillus psychroresistens]|uniref:Competence protein CoiA n=1 Tax=Paenibacillus psychroresistens TaxID=1778678 RepID=A0A6B8RNY1_9BACL|nr:competence protein CoiA family protein [Paenibacillus psychroresistens]QGQ97557.1 competence protein CoiA [Paenibacillus psychroresistens]
MNISKYLGDDFNLTNYISQSTELERSITIEKVKRMSEKGAMTCPFCNEELNVRAGAMRDIHFAHLKGKSCLFSEAHDTYQAQIHRENQKHSIIKEAIYNELKSQVIIKPDLHVEYGHIEKASEKWKHYPDIYLKKNGKEFAISVITKVHSAGDENVVKMIKKRNEYFKSKGLNVIWFVEDRELANDYGNRVIHLWEAEYELAIKTSQDTIWDYLLHKLDQEDPKQSIFDIFKYKKTIDPSIDVKSLYYVHSGDEMTFSVYRLILDEKRHPYKAFAVNAGYRVSMSDALVIRDSIILSDAEKDDEDRREFEVLYYSNKKKLQEEYEEQQREILRQQKQKEEEQRSENERQQLLNQESDQRWEERKRNQPQYNQTQSSRFDIGLEAIKEKLARCKISPMLEIYPVFHSHIEYCESIILKIENNENTKNEYDSLLSRIQNMIIPLLKE